MSDKLLMCAYYYGFDKTGCLEVDRVLSAVARAGKAFHHTDGWADRFGDDRCAYAYEAGRRDEANAQAGKRAAERIGNDDTVSPRAEATDAGVQDAALLEAGGEALPPVVHEALEGVRDRSRDAGDALERLAAQIVERRDGKGFV